MYLFISELEKYLWTEKHSDLIVLKSKLLFTELLCPLIMVTSVSDLEKGKLGDGKGWKETKIENKMEMNLTRKGGTEVPVA